MYQAFEGIEFEDNSVALGKEVTVLPEHEATWLIDQLRAIAKNKGRELVVADQGLFRHLPGVELVLRETRSVGYRLFIIKRILDVDKAS